MSINFKSDDWVYVQSEIETLLKNQRNLLEQPDKTFKEKLLANGQIVALKKILALPQTITSAAKGNN